MTGKRRARNFWTKWAPVIWVVLGVVLFPLFAFLGLTAIDSSPTADRQDKIIFIVGLPLISVFAVIGGILTFLTRRPIFLYSPILGFLIGVFVGVVEMVAN